MQENDFSKQILDNVQPAPQKSGFAANSDLDKINAEHSKHMAILTNLYEFWTHKTIIFFIAIFLFIVFAGTRYYLIFYPLSKFALALHEDSEDCVCVRAIVLTRVPVDNVLFH